MLKTLDKTVDQCTLKRRMSILVDDDWSLANFYPRSITFPLGVIARWVLELWSQKLPFMLTLVLVDETHLCVETQGKNLVAGMRIWLNNFLLWIRLDDIFPPPPSSWHLSQGAALLINGHLSWNEQYTASCLNQWTIRWLVLIWKGAYTHLITPRKGTSQSGWHVAVDCH